MSTSTPFSLTQVDLRELFARIIVDYKDDRDFLKTLIDVGARGELGDDVLTLNLTEHGHGGFDMVAFSLKEFHTDFAGKSLDFALFENCFRSWVSTYFAECHSGPAAGDILLRATLEVLRHLP